MVKEVIEEGKVSGLEHKSNHQVAITNLKITFLRNSLINYLSLSLPFCLLPEARAAAKVAYVQQGLFGRA